MYLSTYWFLSSLTIKHLQLVFDAITINRLQAKTGTSLKQVIIYRIESLRRYD